jgi:uncharacterized membrane protein
MKKVGKLFLQGLLAILPIALTLYAIYWLGTTAEDALGGLITVFVGDSYRPGMGLVAGLILVFIFGILLRIWLFRKVFAFAEDLFARIPGIKSIYGSVRDLVGFFDSTKQKDFDKTVMVNFGDGHMRLMGMITREDFTNLPAGIGDQGTVAVYLPMSYQLGGFTVMVPRDRIQPVDMKVDEALQFLLTAGVSSEGKKTAKPA